METQVYNAAVLGLVFTLAGLAAVSLAAISQTNRRPTAGRSVRINRPL